MELEYIKYTEYRKSVIAKVDLMCYNITKCTLPGIVDILKKCSNVIRVVILEDDSLFIVYHHKDFKMDPENDIYKLFKVAEDGNSLIESSTTELIDYLYNNSFYNKHNPLNH